MSRTRRDGLAFTVIVVCVVALCAIPMALIIAASGAPTLMLSAALLAAVPVGPVIGAYLWLDRYEPEPRSLLAMGVAWGAFAATLAALFVQGIGGLAPGFDDATQVTWFAPISEEATKGIFLLLLMWWRRHELDGLLDGIVYAGMVGVGFAFTENILYLAAAYNGTDGFGPGGVEALTGTFIMRCLASPFAHPLFTAFTGVGVGIAVSSRSGFVRFVAPIAGYVAAVAAHATWNGSAVNGTFIGIYLTLMVPVFLLVAGFAFWQRRAERRMLDSALREAATRGLVPATDLPWIVDLRGRKAARRYASQTGGKRARAATEEYQQAAIELGFLHHRYLRGTAPADFAVRGREYMSRMQAVRPSVVFPGQVVPIR
ncbi:MAG: PrsW family intramembrane metalloprotease [Nocardioides sp.]|jgi:RsiW-degrading membrane proteinase PrsW (M82 family)